MRRCIYDIRSGKMWCEEVEPELDIESQPDVVNLDMIDTLEELMCWNLVDQGILQPEDCLGE